MPNPPIDWPAIRSAYETGISQRTLAREYGVSQAAISQKAKKEQWVITPIITPASTLISDKDEPLDTSAAAIAEQARYIIAKAIQKLKQEGFMTGSPLAEYEEHKTLKLLMDSLSQAHKIELTSSQDKPTASGIAAELLPYLDNEQLAQLASLNAQQEEILETARAMKLEAEQGIMSIRKKAMG